MRASAYVGRVGGLAAALGIGVAVTVSGATSAWAAPSDSASTGEDTATSAASIGGQTNRSAGRGRSGGATDSGFISGTTISRSEASRTKDQPRAAAVAAPAGESSATTKVSAPAPTAARHDSTTDVFNLPAASTTINATSEPEAVVTQSLAESAGIAPVAAVVTPAAPVITVAAPAGGAESAPNPLAGRNNPLDDPAQSAVSWAAFAAARRDRGSARAAHSMPATLVSTSDLADTEPVPDPVDLTGTRARAAAALSTSTGSAQALTRVAAVTAVDPISAFFGQIQAFVTQIVQAITQAITAIINIFVPVPVNRLPVAGTPTVGIPDAVTGLVLGQINATDPDGDTLTYTGPTITTRGSVIVDSDGSFAYTPAPWAQLTDDSFTVTADDGRGGVAVVTVSVVANPGASAAGVPNGVTAHQIEANVPGWAPSSNFYGTDDGHYFVVTADLPPYSSGWITYLPGPTVVVLTDQNVRPLDLRADWEFTPGTTHEAAIALAGFALQP